MSRNNTALASPAFKQTNKKINPNKKYNHVTSKTDTGASISKSIARSDYIKANYRYKQGEIFRRMKATTLAQLIVEDLEVRTEVNVEDLDEASNFVSSQPFNEPLQHSNHHRRVSNLLSPDPPVENESTATDRSSRSTLLSVIHGVGAIDTASGVNPTPSTLTAAPSRPYLLLDLRDPHDYASCHIRNAHNFHHARLSRAHDSWTPIMQQYINKPGRIIIVYDEDESISTKAAATFVQRGVGNSFMLSGGMKVFADKIPSGLIIGDLPPLCRVKKSGTTFSHNTSLAPLTRENIALIRDRLEESLTEGSITSGFSTGRGLTSSRSSAMATPQSKSTTTNSTRAWR